jgi:cation diffusion facilitator family transporter
MHTHSLEPWQHSHAFDLHHRHAGERRVLIVAWLTAAMMVAEIAGGVAFGSMALLADGLHMGSHFAALGIAYAAYVYARRHADDSRFSFGTGKVNALAGYSSAVLLLVFALIMAGESVVRLFNPIPIAFGQALLVAVLGLVVNGVSALVLGQADSASWTGVHHHDHGHGLDRGKPDLGQHGHHHHDHNLRGAYLHVVADALTSVLAIVALLGGKYLGWMWLDATMGIVGAGLVLFWAAGLAKGSGNVLLDREGPDDVVDLVRTAIERGDTRVADLHVWSLGTTGYAAALSVVSDAPLPADEYRRRIPASARVVHTTIEVHRCSRQAA